MFRSSPAPIIDARHNSAITYADLVAFAGAAVIEEGTIGDSFYIIKSGSATVETKKQGQFATLQAGQFFGEAVRGGRSVGQGAVWMGLCEFGKLQIVLRERLRDWPARALTPVA